MESYRRPNRSDFHLSAEEEAQMADKTREYFDEKAPKRHTKPQRSEYSSKYVDALSVAAGGENHGSDIPEYVEFQRLENDPKHLQMAYNGGKVGEEFVETEYYKDLNLVDKKHHTTGTGFIKVENNANGFSLEPDVDLSSHASSKGNPATNDWIPAANASDMVHFASDKPNRSDN